MKKLIKEGILEKIKDKNLYIFLAITIIFFGVFILKDYTVDSYLFFQETWREPFYHLASLGRLVTAIFWLIFSWTNFDIAYIASFLLAIISTTFSMYECNRILKRNIKNEKITRLLSVLVVINICTLELYMFFEKGIMMLSVLMSILAIGQLDKALQGDKKACIIILIEMFIANCCYQGTVGIFVAMGTIYIVKNSKNIKEFIKNHILVAGLYALPAILNLFIVKLIFHSSRLENGLSFYEKIKSILKTTLDIFKNTFDILPQYLFLGLLLITCIVFVIKIFRNREGKIGLNIFALIYVIIATILSTVAPQIMQAYVYMVPRNTFSLGAILAIVLILAYQRVKMGKVANTCVLLGGILFLSILFFNFMDITIGHYYTNKKDMEIAERIASVVREYEEKTGEIISKVVIYKENIPYQYKDVRYNGDANVRAFYTDWGTRGILDIVLERDVKVVPEKKQEYEEFFKSQAWNEFDEEQIKLEKDTLHLCII